jgi:signal transduction histidine kinase
MQFNFWSWLGLMSNLITIAVALAFFVLMLGLGRRQRGNRSFALFVLCVLAYIGSGQFTQVLLWLDQGGAHLTMYATGALFFFQALALFLFAGRLVHLRSGWFNAAVLAGLVAGLAGLVALAGGHVIDHPRLSPTGLLRWDTYPLGLVFISLAFVWLAAAWLLLLAHRSRLPHPMLLVGTGILAGGEMMGLTGSLFAIKIPVLTLSITAGVTSLGLSMVHYQLFKPLNDMTRELQARQIDLQERNRRLEEANARLHELDAWREKMTDMLVHDLKNPVNVIGIVLSDFQSNLSGQLNDTQSGLLQSALISLRRLQGLVSGMLDLRRLEEGRLKVKPACLELASVIERCLEAAQPVFGLYQIEVTFHKPPVPALVCADRTVIARVIDNLIDNAVKFSPAPGAISISLQLGPDHIRFSLRDNGPGVAPEYQHSIFEKFFQVETKGRESARGGIGLGLAFCRLAVEAQDGKIWVESDGRNGATFHFTLPVWQEKATTRGSDSETVQRADE